MHLNFFTSPYKNIKLSTKPHSSLFELMGCDAYHAFSTSNQKSGQKLHSGIKYLSIYYLGCIETCPKVHIGQSPKMLQNSKSSK